VSPHPARPEDAEDAFQATFLVFLRKATSIWPREKLGNWLYGVAYKTACKARQTVAKRDSREKPVDSIPEPGTEPRDNGAAAELLAILDRELYGLPQKYRTAVVLCELQGRTIRDVAQELRVAEGTVASRLARGRELLARRMTKHVAGVSAGAVAAVCSQQAALAALPHAVLTQTIEAVGLVAAGQTVTPGPLDPGASPLVESVLHGMAVAKRKAVAVVLLLAGLAIGGGIVTYKMIPSPPTRAEQRAETPSPPPAPEQQAKPPEEPNAKKYGTAAGARNFAKNHLRDHLSTLPVYSDRFVHYDKFGRWPSRDIEATFDPATHQWTLSGTYRFDVRAGLPFMRRPGDGTKILESTKEWSCHENEWRLVLAYNPSARAYEVKKTEIPDMWDWRRASKDDFARWLQGRYPEPRPSSKAITALQLVVEAPEPTKLGLRPNYTYGNKDLTALATPRGVSVRIDHGAGGPVERWDLQFGGPQDQFVKAGKYGGAYDPEKLFGNPGPLLVVRHGLVDAGKQASEWSCDPGEFVVREIEIKDKKVVRLAIDFIADNEYSRPVTAKRDTRCIVRGSLRVNSLLQPSVPNLDVDAADFRLTDPAPAGLRGMKFVPLPKGTFYMGYSGTKGSAKQREIKENFEIAVYTVTQGQWQELMWNNPSWFSRQGGGKEAVKDIKDEELKKFPVENVSWNDVQAFIKRLNEREKGKGYVYRLPTQAEWEYACRGGATTEEACSYHFYFEKPTNDLSSKQANFNGNQPFGKGEKGPYLERTTKVGSYAPNMLGLYDMHGNVSQCCSRVSVRGGSWNNSAETCRAMCRSAGYPSEFGGGSRPESIGFRLVRVRVR